MTAITGARATRLSCQLYLAGREPLCFRLAMSSRVAQFQALVNRHPENELFRFSLAQALVAEQQESAALPHLDECIARKPDWMVARILRGKCLLALDRRAEARTELETARRLAVEQQHEDPERELGALLADLAR